MALAMGLAGFALESDTCSGAGAAGQSALSVHGQAAPSLLPWIKQPGRGWLASLVALLQSVLGTGNSLENFSTWKSRAFFPQFHAPLIRGDWKPLPGHPCSWEVKVLCVPEPSLNLTGSRWYLCR